MNGPNYRVGWVVSAFMLIIGFLLDAAQFFLSLTGIGEVASWFISPSAGFTYWVWFKLLGVDYLGGKRVGAKIGSALGSMVIELIPFVNDLPGITVGIAGVIWASRKEDKQKFEEERAAAQKASADAAQAQAQAAQAMRRAQIEEEVAHAEAA